MKFGCLKSPHDKRDILFESILIPISLPENCDFTPEFTPVRNQQNEGTCVGFAMVVGCMEFWEKEENIRVTELSPRFLYYNAQKIDGHPKKHEGTHLLAACKVAQVLGTCLENFLPYIPKEEIIPDEDCYINALRYRIKTYVRIRNLQELKQAIYDEKVQSVLIGVNVFKGMISDQAKNTGVVPNPSCWDTMNVLGGHALCAGGYDDKSSLFKNDGHIKVKNSWGDKYGDKGYLYLSYSYIKNNMLDAYACVDIRPEDLKKYPYRRIGKDKEWIK